MSEPEQISIRNSVPDASLSAIGLATDTGTNPQAGLDGLVAVMANGRAPR